MRATNFLDLPLKLRQSILSEAFIIPKNRKQGFTRGQTMEHQFTNWENDIKDWAINLRQVHEQVARDLPEDFEDRCRIVFLRKWLPWVDAKLVKTPKVAHWRYEYRGARLTWVDMIKLVRGEI